MGDIPKRLLDISGPPFFPPTGFVTQIVDFINTPRDVYRLCNALSVTFPAVQGEVNIADFVAVEALRILAPDIYEMVRNNKQAFVGKSLPDALKMQIKEVVDHHSDGTVLGRMLSDLFPGIGIWTYAIYDELTWNQDLRICSAEFFDIYFRFFIATNSVSTGVVQTVLAATTDVNGLTDILTEFAVQNPQRLRSLLYRLQDHVQGNYPSSNSTTLIRVLLNIGDQLAVPEGGKRVNELRVAMFGVVWILLQQTEPAEQIEILAQALSEGHANVLGIVVAGELLREHTKDSQARNVLIRKDFSPNEKKVLEQLALAKIRKVLLSNQSFDENCQTALFLWMELDTEGAKEWLKQATQEPKNLVNFLKLFLIPIPPNDGCISTYCGTG